MSIEAINPANGEVIATYDEMAPGTVKTIVEDVHKAFLEWRRASFGERGRPMRQAAEILRTEASNFARLMALAREPWPLPLGLCRNRRSLLARRNLIDAVHLVLASPAARGETYVVADPTPLMLTSLSSPMMR